MRTINDIGIDAKSDDRIIAYFEANNAEKINTYTSHTLENLATALTYISAQS
jgi:hypothetical protein